MVDVREPVERQRLLEALGLSTDAVIEPLAGGASGSAWRVAADGRSYTLRRSSLALTAGRLAAMAAARNGGLDLARTHSMLTIEPGLATLPEAARAALRQFVEAWADGYRPEASAIPSTCLHWAGLVMLADLGARYAADPARLEDVRRWTDSWI